MSERTGPRLSFRGFIASPWRLSSAVMLAAAAAAVFACAVIGGRTYYYVAADVGGAGPPSPLLEHPEQTGIPGLTDVAFPSRDGTALGAWYVPSRNGAAVVISAGTDANRSSMLSEIRILSSAGFGVLAFDWPGTGSSQGTINWGNGAPAALEGAIDWLAEQPDVKNSQLGALGFSAGGAITVRVAVEDQRLRSIVLTGTSPASNESPFWFHRSKQPLKVLPAEWAARWYGWPVGRLRPIDLVGRISPRPVLIIGGSDDPNASPPMCDELMGAAGQPKEVWIAPGATHGDYAQAAPVEYARHLTEFLHRTLLRE